MENWRKYLTESLSKQLTDSMHEKWLAGYRANNGEVPRLKPVPTAEGESAEQALERLEEYEKIQIIDGILQQDINQPAEKIVPELAHKLNGAPAVDYADIVEEIEISGPEDIKNLAREFHKIWEKHNDWQRESNPELFVPYDNLPSDEKLKDLDQLKVALDLQYRDCPEIQQYFEELYSRT